MPIAFPSNGSFGSSTLTDLLDVYKRQVLLEEEVYDVTLLVALLVLDMMLVCKLLCGCIIRYLVDVYKRQE